MRRAIYSPRVFRTPKTRTAVPLSRNEKWFSRQARCKLPNCLNCLSGIGSAALVSDLDIPVLVDNGNVGENLQDHLNCGF